MLRILHVVGARLTFAKMAPVIEALRAYPEVYQTVAHSGQHHDESEPLPE